MTSVHISKKITRTISLYNKANWGDIKQNIIRIFEQYLQLNDQYDISVELNWQYIKYHLVQLTD